MEQNNQKMVIKKRKLENDSSEESDSEDSEDEDTENHKSFAVKKILRKITQMNSHLFMIYDVLYHMMNETKQQTFLRDIRDGELLHVVNFSNPLEREQEVKVKKTKEEDPNTEEDSTKEQTIKFSTKVGLMFL